MWTPSEAQLSATCCRSLRQPAMPRLRSQTVFTSILPPELLERCLEFLPFEEVHTNAKQVSKAMRSAARRCLTRGRWRPLKYVVENAMVTNADERPSSAAETATFRAAWAVASFIFWLREWDTDELHRLSDIALALSRNWQDRQKAGAFVAAAVFFVARLTSDLDEVPAA